MRLSRVASLVLVACGGGTVAESTEVTDTGYSHECTVDDDCIPVHFGSVCAMCRSSNAAIAKSGESAYQRATENARSHCPPRTRVGKCAVRETVTRCTANRCEIVQCEHDAVSPHACGDGGT